MPLIVPSLLVHCKPWTECSTSESNNLIGLRESFNKAVGEMNLISLIGIILSVVVVILVLLIVVFLRRYVKSGQPQMDQKQLENAVTNSLTQNTELIKMAVSAGITSSQDTLKGSVALALKDLKVDETIGQLQTAIEGISNNSSTLLNMLESGPARGSFGETQMERLLRDTIAPSYIHIRESKKGLGTPDAYIDSPYGIVCIDSKFPLANYRRLVETSEPEVRKRASSDFARDVKSHLSKVAAYVQPESGTARVALAFIPSESVYAYLCENESKLIEDACKSGVIVSSPSTLLENLTLISVANRAAEIDENAKEILKRIDGLSTSIHKCYDDWKVLYKHLYDAYWKSEAVEHSFDMLKNGFESASAILDHSSDSKPGN